MRSAALARSRSGRTHLDRGFVAVRVRDNFYAVPIEKVQEIVQPVGLTSLPQAPPGVIGAVDHRGDVVPVLDLGLRLGLGRSESARRKWILFRDGPRRLGLVVDAVIEVFRVPTNEVRPAPDVGHPELRSATEVVTFQGTIAFILELEVLYQAADLRTSAEATS